MKSRALFPALLGVGLVMAAVSNAQAFELLDRLLVVNAGHGCGCESKCGADKGGASQKGAAQKDCGCARRSRCGGCDSKGKADCGADKGAAQKGCGRRGRCGGCDAKGKADCGADKGAAQKGCGRRGRCGGCDAKGKADCGADKGASQKGCNSCRTRRPLFSRGCGCDDKGGKGDCGAAQKDGAAQKGGASQKGSCGGCRRGLFQDLFSCNKMCCAGKSAKGCGAEPSCGCGGK